MNGAGEATPLPWTRSLRARGLVATLALLAYVGLAGLYVAAERVQINTTVQAQGRLLRHEQALAVAAAGLSATLLDLDAAQAEAAPSPALASALRQSLDGTVQRLGALDEFDPAYAALQRLVQRQRSDGSAPSPGLRDALLRANAELDIRRQRLADEREQVDAQYRRSYDGVTVTTLLLTMAGLLVFGSLAAWFFTRLAGDVSRLELHARRIVQGTRGVALPVAREDELGRLMHAVNRMAKDLDARERQLEIEGQRRSHQDKMLAVGALAAGMAHEVNNPLTVIQGTAQELREGAAQRGDAQGVTQADTILAHTQRAAQAARALADAAAPQPSAHDWLDLEALVRRALKWMVYDRRYRNLAFDLQMEPALPAVRSAPDTVQQVLMQLLSLACDAHVHDAQARSAPLQVGLRQRNDAVELRLSSPAAPDFTREDVQRTIMGARAALASLGAELAFGQEHAGGRHIKLVLPMQHDFTPLR